MTKHRPNHKRVFQGKSAKLEFGLQINNKMNRLTLSSLSRFVFINIRGILLAFTFSLYARSFTMRRNQFRHKNRLLESCMQDRNLGGSGQ